MWKPGLREHRRETETVEESKGGRYRDRVPVREAVSIATNDLEAPVLARKPALGSLRDALLEAGADISILCGSGSCVAGIFADEVGRDAAAERAEGLAGVRPIRTRTLGPEAPLPG